MRPLAIAVLIGSFILGNLSSVFAGDWKSVGEITVVIALMAASGWFGYAMGRGVAKHEQIVREEIDEPRADRTPPTNTTGETR